MISIISTIDKMIIFVYWFLKKNRDFIMDTNKFNVNIDIVITILQII